MPKSSLATQELALALPFANLVRLARFLGEKWADHERNIVNKPSCPIDQDSGLIGGHDDHIAGDLAEHSDRAQEKARVDASISDTLANHGGQTKQ